MIFGPTASRTALSDAHHPRQLLRADHAVERLDPLAARMIVVGQVQRVGIGVVQIEFDRGKARRDHLLGASRVLGRLMRFAFVAIGVDADLVTEAAAEEGRDRQAVRASHQVPERDLDAGNRGDDDAGLRTLAGEGTLHDEDETRDVGRVLADQQAFGAMNDFGDAGAPIGLAEPGHACVGLDAHQNPGEVAGDDGGANVGDLHGKIRLPIDLATPCRHSRVSGNPEPEHVRQSLDARFRGHDTGLSSPHFEPFTRLAPPRKTSQARRGAASSPRASGPV